MYAYIYYTYLHNTFITLISTTHKGRDIFKNDQASARADRRHTAAIRPSSSVKGRADGGLRWHRACPKAERSKRKLNGNQWASCGCIHLVNKSTNVTRCTFLPMCLSTVTESISIKECLLSMYARLSLLNVPATATIIMVAGVTRHEYS